MGLSLGTLYSEAAVITTGCGPINIGDSLERVCYICVLIISASSLFVRIVQRTSLTKFVCEVRLGRGWGAGAKRQPIQP